MEDTDRRALHEQWKYKDHFREYLLLLARKGEMALEMLANYPKEIELGKDIHRLLNQFRKLTEDGYERYGFIGANPSEMALKISSGNLPMGTQHNVPAEIRVELEKKAMASGVEVLIGDIHSHTEQLPMTSRERLTQMGLTAAAFSPQDYHGLMVGPFFFRVVSEPDVNLFAMKAKDSRGLGTDERELNVAAFSKYWVGEFGMDQKMQLDDLKRRIQMNIAISAKHNLALYVGAPDQNLKRLYPEV